MTDTDHCNRAALMLSRALAMADISQTELARRMHTSHGCISRWVRGKRNMRIATLFKAIDCCGLEIVELTVRRKPIQIEAT